MPGGHERAKITIERILSLSDEETYSNLHRVLASFSLRHRNVTKIFEDHFDRIVDIMKEEVDIGPDTISLERKLLMGAYFTMEYAISSAAFFNPSIVEDPDQYNLEDGQKRVILSFRATGEGHISSIEFRGGVLDKDNNLRLEPAGELVDVPETVKRHVYDKKHFLKKLHEMKLPRDVIGMVVDNLPDKFIYGELQASIAHCFKEQDVGFHTRKILRSINWVAKSHYEVSFSLDTAISERVIFPVSYTESKGIEDARFVRFVDDDGSVTYYATYVAYNGLAILPKLLETKDFYHFKVSPLYGECVQNKDLALFPRKINGKYAMVSRFDNVNNYIIYSEDIHIWQNAHKIQEPRYAWELMQVGNCGSPVETEEGWLLITHGVGPMRTYSLGAVLLDRKDPSRIIGRLEEPLISPNEEERVGYVPNVVYSCGSIIHNNELVIPYAMSDYASTIATVPLDALLGAMAKGG